MVVINKKEGRDEIDIAVYTVLRKAEWSIIWEIKERKNYRLR